MVSLATCNSPEPVVSVATAVGLRLNQRFCIHVDEHRIDSDRNNIVQQFTVLGISAPVLGIMAPNILCEMIGELTTHSLIQCRLQYYEQ